MGENPWIIVYSIAIVFSMACFNGSGVAVTKYGSSPQRATLDTARTVIIWLFFLIFPVPGGEVFSYLQLVGYIMIVPGTLIYNEIVVIPFCGFD